MKKLFSVFTAFIIFATIFTSCEKQEFEETKSENQKVINFNTFDLTVKNNMLSFASVENFDNALAYLAKDEQSNFENWNKKSEFNSMAKAYKNNKAEMPADDDILANFLNAESVVEIQGKIFKLDFDKRIVLVYENNEAYLNSKYSKTYTFDDEVLTLEFGTKEEVAELSNQKTSYAPNWNPAYRHFAQGLIDYKIAYHKDGIYYTLVAKIEDNIACAASEINIPRVAFNWKNKKKQSENYPTLKTKQSENGQTCGKFKIRPYAGTRRLTHYSIDADFKATYTSPNLDDENDHWAHSY